MGMVRGCWFYRGDAFLSFFSTMPPLSNQALVRRQMPREAVKHAVYMHITIFCVNASQIWVYTISRGCCYLWCVTMFLLMCEKYENVNTYNWDAFTQIYCDLYKYFMYSITAWMDSCMRPHKWLVSTQLVSTEHDVSMC